MGSDAAIPSSLLRVVWRGAELSSNQQQEQQTQHSNTIGVKCCPLYIEPERGCQRTPERKAILVIGTRTLALLTTHEIIPGGDLTAELVLAKLRQQPPKGASGALATALQLPPEPGAMLVHVVQADNRVVTAIGGPVAILLATGQQDREEFCSGKLGGPVTRATLHYKSTGFAKGGSVEESQEIEPANKAKRRAKRALP